MEDATILFAPGEGDDDPIIEWNGVRILPADERYHIAMTVCARIAGESLTVRLTPTSKLGIHKDGFFILGITNKERKAGKAELPSIFCCGNVVNDPEAMTKKIIDFARQCDRKLPRAAKAILLEHLRLVASFPFLQR